MSTVEELGQRESSNVRVPTYLVQSIITLVVFAPLFFIGWIPVMFALSVSNNLTKGDVDAARQASERARAWAITNYWLGVILYTILAISYFIYYSLFRNA